MLLSRQNMLDHDLVITMTYIRYRTLIIRYKITSDYRANLLCRSLSWSRGSIPTCIIYNRKGRALTVDDEPSYYHSNSSLFSGDEVI
jgi:hypothetical protein